MIKETFHCTFCDIGYINKGVLKQHERESSPEKNNSPCYTCSNMFVSVEEFERA